MIWYVLGFLLTAALLLIGGMDYAVKCLHGQQSQKRLLPFQKACCWRWSCWDMTAPIKRLRGRHRPALAASIQYGRRLRNNHDFYSGLSFTG